MQVPPDTVVVLMIKYVSLLSDRVPIDLYFDLNKCWFIKIERGTNDSISIKGGTNWCKTGSKLIQTAEQIKSDKLFLIKYF